MHMNTLPFDVLLSDIPGIFIVSIEAVSYEVWKLHIRMN